MITMEMLLVIFLILEKKQNLKQVTKSVKTLLTEEVSITGLQQQLLHLTQLILYLMISISLEPQEINQQV